MSRVLTVRRDDNEATGSVMAGDAFGWDDPVESSSEGKTPSPGSEEALDLGCTCPVLDNAHGVGYLGIPDVYVYTKDCPLHDEAADVDPESAIGPVCDTCGHSSAGGLKKFNLYLMSASPSPQAALASLRLCRPCVNALLLRIHSDYCKSGCKDKHDFGPWAELDEGAQPA
ncbi:hypothetical protein LCGC14_2990910 [marine sediment metagenome]|uniref:Uncharacterized protein n=1 Tax=marine sediment metagenome TaxID=412755 RepID=A0A0F8X3S8_9ZZZZ